MTMNLFGLSPQATFAFYSAVLSSFAFLPYIIDTLRGGTRPQRASWLIWSILGAIAFLSQVFEGATHSLWFAGIQVSGTMLVFALSIRRGIGGFLTKGDRLVLGLAAGGLLAWYLTETAVYTLAITISISVLGGTVTIAKAFNAPQSETMTTWALSFVASICAILAVGKLDWVLLAYPLYLLGLNGAIVLAIWAGRTRQGRSAMGRSNTMPV